VVSLSSSGLDDTVLTGQSLSWDLVLTHEVLARISVPDPSAFGTLLIVFTDAPTYPGFAGSTTGYLLDPNGGQFGETVVAGRSDSSNGSFSTGLFFTSPFGGDISGAHFDTTFPSTGYTVTNAELVFSLQSQYDTLKFGTAQQLPDSSTSTLTLLVLAAFALAMWRSSSSA